MTFCTLPCSRWNRTHKIWNTCIVPFAIAELGQRCLEAALTQTLNSCITLLSFWIRKIYFNVMLLNTFSRNKTKIIIIIVVIYELIRAIYTRKNKTRLIFPRINGPIVRNLTWEWSAGHSNSIIYKKQKKDNAFKKITIKRIYMHASKNWI